MHSPGINGERELRGQLANPGSPGKMAIKSVMKGFYIHKNVKVCMLLSIYQCSCQ